MIRPLSVAFIVGAASPCLAQTAPDTSEVRAWSATPTLRDDTSKVLLGDLWKRGILSPRDRSLVTVSALVAGGHADELRPELERALDDGVKPSELSAAVDHLAFYAGWPVAQEAAGMLGHVYGSRGIVPTQETAKARELAPAERSEDQTRADGVRSNVGPVAPGLADLTNGVLFDDVWRRTDLSPRDRSLVTISALVATGQTGQLTYHTGLGLRNGLTRPEVGEALTQLAFYAGWPRAYSALPFVKAAFDEAAKP